MTHLESLGGNAALCSAHQWIRKVDEAFQQKELFSWDSWDPVRTLDAISLLEAADQLKHLNNPQALSALQEEFRHVELANSAREALKIFSPVSQRTALLFSMIEPRRPAPENSRPAFGQALGPQHRRIAREVEDFFVGCCFLGTLWESEEQRRATQMWLNEQVCFADTAQFASPFFGSFWCQSEFAPDSKETRPFWAVLWNNSRAREWDSELVHEWAHLFLATALWERDRSEHLCEPPLREAFAFWAECLWMESKGWVREDFLKSLSQRLSAEGQCREEHLVGYGMLINALHLGKPLPLHLPRSLHSRARQD